MTKMTSNEIGPRIGWCRNIQSKLNDAAGIAVGVELRMRLIGELSEEVRGRLNELISKEREKLKSENKKTPRHLKTSNYWDCQLSSLEK